MHLAGKLELIVLKECVCIPSHSGYSMIHSPSLPHTADPGFIAVYPLIHLSVAVLCA